MRIALYDPYLDTLGGGEKYLLEAGVYLAKTHEVTLFWDPAEKDKIAQETKVRFDLDLKAVNFTKNIFVSESSFIQRFLVTRKYDALIYMSDGSIPFLFAKKNILMFQHPVDWVKTGLLTKKKLSRINKIFCNSKFTKTHIDKTFAIDSLVIPPAVENTYKSGVLKEKVILTVGRFTSAMNAKKQDIMIDTFKSLSKSLPEWRLILAGGMKDVDKEFYHLLEEKAKGFPITLMPNIAHTELINLYNKAVIYWHATGFGEDIEKHPERTEHFGISTVEAMSAGCVPIVFSAGGQREIVRDGVNGFEWKTVDELEEKTTSVIQNIKLRDKLSLTAMQTAKEYTKDRFYLKISSLIA